jgi:hypothetical protein
MTMDQPKHMVEVRGELIPHPGPPVGHSGPWEKQPHDWMVKITLARWETVHWQTREPLKEPGWREVDSTVVNHHADFGQAQESILDLMRKLFKAVGVAQAVRLIIQKTGDVLTLDWKPHPDAADVPVSDAKALAVAKEVMLEGKALLLKCGLIAS